MVNTCIIPAAGRGARWAPVSGYLPKELLPLIDKPVIEWVIDEAVASNCSRIIVVINKQKETIKKYLTKNRKKFKPGVTFEYVYQNEPIGIAHALWLCRNLITSEPFVVALPDLPTISRKPVVKQLVDAFDKNGSKSHVVSFDRFSHETLQHYGECLIEATNNQQLKIIHFCPKTTESNPGHNHATHLRMSGRFIFTAEIFPIINSLLKKQPNSEISDRSALRSALNSGQSVFGFQIKGHTYDTGFPNGYVKANTAFFKKQFHKKGII